MDLIALLQHIAVPRPNHGSAVDETARFLVQWLTGWGIDVQTQAFVLRPWIMLAVALALVLCALLFVIAIVKKRPKIALVLALGMPLLLVAEMEQFTPVVSWIGSKPGSNIVVQYQVPQPARELVFMAHYDSKTDFWDHEQRAQVYRLMLPFFGLALALALWTFAVRRRQALGRGAPRAVAVALATLYLGYIGLVALGFGGFVFVDQRHDSPGVVDDATSVTALLALAKNIQQHKVDLGTSNVTIVLTGGEEVILQGAHHYVKERLKRGIDPNVPVSLVNLELAGQVGQLNYRRGDGVFLKFYAPDPALRERVGAAWKAVSGQDMVEGEPSTNDAERFHAAGLPAITIGHDGLPGPGHHGLHSEADNLTRVDAKNLELTVRMLEKYITSF